MLFFFNNNNNINININNKSLNSLIILVDNISMLMHQLGSVSLMSLYCCESVFDASSGAD